jgi:hypothetical protein
LLTGSLFGLHVLLHGRNRIEALGLRKGDRQIGEIMNRESWKLPVEKAARFTFRQGEPGLDRVAFREGTRGWTYGRGLRL